jgi:hypothetical protein
LYFYQAGGVVDVIAGDVLPPTFTVTSSAPEYDRSEPIRLTLTLSLDSNLQTPVTVSTFKSGSISIALAMRNGASISPTEGAVRFVQAPKLLQIASLTTIAPGEHVIIPFEVTLVPGQGSRLIVERINPEGSHDALIYSLTEPGQYVLQFLYQYTGPENDESPSVFRGEVLSNTIRFRLR